MQCCITGMEESTTGPYGANVFVTVVQEADDSEVKAREKQARVEASMKEREKEVKESLESSLRERDKERDQHKKDEAVQSFKALLVDLVQVALKYTRRPVVL